MLQKSKTNKTEKQTKIKNNKILSLDCANNIHIKMVKPQRVVDNL